MSIFGVPVIFKDKVTKIVKYLKPNLIGMERKDASNNREVLHIDTSVNFEE